jgi:hypothetical protein
MSVSAVTRFDPSRYFEHRMVAEGSPRQRYCRAIDKRAFNEH